MNSPSESSANPERVAIFGGAFDPFHNGHSVAIRHLLGTEGVDHVIVVPSGNRPDKQGVSSASDRLAMARLGVAQTCPQDSRVTVSDLQVTGAVGYATIDLLLHFAKNLCGDIVIVIGQELVPELPRWVRAEELKDKATFLVLQRPGSKAISPPEGWKCVLSKPFANGGLFVSSTELRTRLKAGERCEELLSEPVYRYCTQNRLYSALNTR
jgi:nicotinate-nucleotide adenylyltransferase